MPQLPPGRRVGAEKARHFSVMLKRVLYMLYILSTEVKPSSLV